MDSTYLEADRLEQQAGRRGYRMAISIAVPRMRLDGRTNNALADTANHTFRQESESILPLIKTSDIPPDTSTYFMLAIIRP